MANMATNASAPFEWVKKNRALGLEIHVGMFERAINNA